MWDEVESVRKDILIPALIDTNPFDPEFSTKVRGWFVGGMVRDFLNNKPEYNDLDIVVTDKKVFEYKLRNVLNRMGVPFTMTPMSNGHATVVGVELEGHSIRMDISELLGYEDMSIEERLNVDAQDRDFTCNAWYMEICEGNTKPFQPNSVAHRDNIYSHQDKVLTACHGSHTFITNPVRVFRAALLVYKGYTPNASIYTDINNVRCTLPITPVDSTRVACLQLVDKIIRMVSESNNTDGMIRAFNFLADVGGWGLIHPTIQNMTYVWHNNDYHHDSIWQHTMDVVRYVSYNRKPWYTLKETQQLIWAALLHDVGKPATLTTDDTGKTHFYEHHVVGAGIAKEIFQGYDGILFNNVPLLIKLHMETKRFGDDPIPPKQYKVIRRMMWELKDPGLWEMWKILNAGDFRASERTCNVNSSHVEQVEHAMKMNHEPDWFTYRLPIYGTDIIKEFGLTHKDKWKVAEYKKQLMDVTFRNPAEYETKGQCIHYLRTLSKDWMGKVEKHHAGC